jgi:cytoskeletal protein RodZ
MSPEEFDNRLKSSFQDEYLPPKDQLWQNINQRLDANAKKPFWYWLVPALIVVSAGIIWIGNGLSTDRISENPPVQTVENLAEASGKGSSPASSDALAMDNSTSASAEAGQTPENSSQTAIADADDRTSDAAAKPSRPKYVSPYKNPLKATNPETGGRDVSNAPNQQRDNSGGGTNSQNDNGSNSTGSDNSVNGSETPSNPEYQSLGFRINSYPRFPVTYDLSAFDLAPWLKTTYRKKSQDPEHQGSHSAYRYNFNNADLASKWWFEIGMGPQVNYNRVKVQNDSQAYVHKDLWSKRNKLSNKGVGFQANASLLYKFGKDERFGLKFGLSYGKRVEDIKMNESTYDIEHRDQSGADSGQIDFYKMFKIYIAEGSDTTWFMATQSFTLLSKNIYHVFTIPVSISAEQKLSENTFLSFGLGAGLSLIYSDSSRHLNMITEGVVRRTQSVRFSTSLNGTLGLYHNFNDYGQVGIYAGYQMYLQPWKVFEKQYSISMSDLQFGVTFRKPLHWGE